MKKTIFSTLALAACIAAGAQTEVFRLVQSRRNSSFFEVWLLFSNFAPRKSLFDRTKLII